MTLVYLTIGWLAGIALAHRLWQAGLITCDRPSPVIWGAAGAAILGLALALQRERRARLSFFILLFGLLGGLRYQSHPLWPCFTSADLAYYNGDEDARVWAVIEGLVVDDPEVRDRYTRLRVRAERVTIEGRSRAVDGLVLVHADRFGHYAYGDRVRVSGILGTPPHYDDFDYRAYLARRGVYSLIRRARVQVLERGGGSPFWRALYTVRRHAQERIARLLPSPEAPLLTGILLGVESGIPRALYEAFNATSTSHIIVISGFNITIIAGIFMAGASRAFGRRWATPLALTGITLYVLLVGADAAVTRAGIMGALGVIALHLGRQSTAIVSLAFSALVMTALNPLTLWDIGFQLSAMATLGLILFVPPLQRLLDKALANIVDFERVRHFAGLINEGLIVTLAAQITTTPLVVYYFGRLSLISLLTNFLILPVQPYIMTWGGLAVLLDLVPGLHLLAQIVAYLPWLCLAYTVRVVEAMARLPFAWMDIGHVPVSVLLTYYLALGGGLIMQDKGIDWRTWIRRVTRHLPSKALAGGLFIAVILVWVGAVQSPDGLLHVFFLDVGQGDAILIQTPGGHQVLVDGGPSPTQLAWRVGEHMPFWDRDLSVVVLTHPDGDHMNGLIPLLDRYRVDWVIDSPVSERAPEAQPWLTALSRVRARREIARRGLRLHLGDGVWLDVLHPPMELLANTDADDNNNSTVIRVGYGRICFLLTGDAERAAEQSLLTSGQPLRCPVLKVSHHGSAGATSAEFLAAVRPQIAVIQVGADNRFGHPAPEVLERLKPARIYRTDEDGTVEVITDGEHLWVRTER